MSILLPWGELLTAVAEPDPSLLKALATLAQPGAAIEIVLSHDPGRDPRVLALPPCYELDAAAVRDRLKAAYDGSGLELLEVETLDQRALVDYPTTWAKRLAHGRPRRIWRIRATRS